jgi:hypothetical protein
MRPRFWFLVIAAFALSACADTPRHAARAEGAEQAARSTAKKTPVAVAARPPEVAIATPQTAPLAETADDIASRLGEHERAEEVLIGIDERGAENLFGTPHRRHDNATNKTWYYRDGSCALDLYFYMDMSSRVFRTLAYEVSSNDQSAESRDQCIARLQSAKQSAGSGNRQARN